MTEQVERPEYPTHISVMDTGYTYMTPQPVMGIYNLFTPAPQPEAPLGTVDPTEDDAAKAEAEAKALAEAESKVITNPGKDKAAKAADASANVETK